MSPFHPPDVIVRAAEEDTVWGEPPQTTADRLGLRLRDIADVLYRRDRVDLARSYQRAWRVYRDARDAGAR